MQVHVSVHLQNYRQNLLTITLDAQGQPGSHGFTLSALAAGNGISVVNWQITGGEGRVDGAQFHVSGAAFRLQYDLEIMPHVCLGSDLELDFTYPFLNPDEIFFGTGILPIPHEPCDVTVQLVELPEGWSEFSSLTPGGMHPDKLNEFFCYCAADLVPFTHRYQGQRQEVTFRVQVQRGKELPIPVETLFAFFDAYLNWLEDSLVPYQRAAEINFLVLQAPPNFADLANGRTFATGENVLNGIVCYAPPAPDYLQRVFGYPDYARFLYEGLAHELLHSYTSASRSGRQKSVLYPAPHCPAYAVRLLADALNNYFYSRYVSEHVPEAQDAFEMWTARSRLRQQKTSQRQPLLDLLQLDEYLQENGASLLALFREMLQLKLETRQPYESAGFLFDTLRERLGIQPPRAFEDEILLQA